MTPLELRSTAALAAVFAARLLGLFMIYPVFAGYASHLQGATPEMIGMALGAYGLTQGLLQVPYGLASDHVGRKRMIAGGLLLFAIGSVVAALANSVVGLLIGRTLQGTGAVGSVILALVADLTREEVRTRAMAMIGMTIGLSFAVAIVLGPILAGTIGVPGVFWLTALLAATGIGATYGLVPTPERVLRRRDVEAVPGLFAGVLHDRELLRLDFSIFALHLILTASFLAVPLVLMQTFDLPVGHDWIIYLPVLAGSIVFMVPIILIAEKGGRMKEAFMATIVLIAASQLTLALGKAHPPAAIVALLVFFIGFNVMEALLPSLVTKMAPAHAKGTATGLFSSAQFLGIFAGGASGGLAAAIGEASGVFALTLIVALVWLAVAAGMSRPGRYANHLARVGRLDLSAIGELTRRIRAAPGVMDVVIAPDEGVAYLKIDRTHFDPGDIARIIGV